MGNPSIHILPDEVINQIAAGETIEGPASVVKELIENAIDAGSSSVVVEIKGGGLQLIRVSDNGKGMGEEDVLLCFCKHATSKIARAEDLVTVRSMGFRGEALSSIASVAHLSLTTATHDAGGGGRGVYVRVEGGRLVETKGTARGGGTTVEVHSLFYNVPARRGDQKTKRGREGDLLSVGMKASLSYPEVSLKLFVDDLLLLSTPLSKGKESMEALREVIAETLGSNFLKGAIPLSYREGPAFLWGFLGHPAQVRLNRSGQFLSINKRSVFSPLVSSALAEGCGAQIADKRYPSCVLHLEVPPEWIDPNVHPQKREVRLRKEATIRQMVIRGVVEGLRVQERGTSLSLPAEERKEKATPFKTYVPPSHLLREERVEESPFQEDMFTNSLEETKANPLAHLKVIGLFSPYLLIEGSSCALHIPHVERPYDGLLIVNLVGAQTRVWYHAFLSKEKTPPSLQEIDPVVVEYTLEEANLISLHLKELERLGVSARKFGPTSFVVEAIGSHLTLDKVHALITKMVVLLSKNGKDCMEKRWKRELAWTLCQHLRQSKKSWKIEEGMEVLSNLFDTPSPYVCPRGKKIISYLRRREFEKMFS